MSVRAVFILSASMLLLSGTWTADQPTCRVIWLAKMPCAISLSALINQVKIWSNNQCSDPQEKCMYELWKYSSNTLDVNHTSLITNTSSTISFFFSSSAPPVSPVAPSFCKLMAVSTSNTSNTTSNDYCLIYNLIDGSGLTQVKGAKEICNKKMCPSRAKATCKIA